MKFEQVFHVGRLPCRSSCVESDSTRTELNRGGELRKPLFPKFDSTVQLDGHNKPQKDMWHLNFERSKGELCSPEVRHDAPENMGLHLLGPENLGFSPAWSRLLNFGLELQSEQAPCWYNLRIVSCTMNAVCTSQFSTKPRHLDKFQRGIFDMLPHHF